MSLIDRAPQVDDLTSYREAFASIADVCARVARGDLEARVPLLDGGDEVSAVRNSLNGMLDLTDAFVREAGASLNAASEGRFHRKFLSRGMLGSFRDGAERVDEARGAMLEAATQIGATESDRLRLADEFENVVLAASEQVAAASTELGATAATVAESAQASVEEAGRAASTVSSLTSSSERMRSVVSVIDRVANQTHLLALNATIEAARAGEAGRGFAVVATEVKTLANETASATATINDEIEAVLAAAVAASGVIDGIAQTVREMYDNVVAIAEAVGGRVGTSDMTDAGLSQLAEMLRTEVTGFLAALRPVE